MKGHRHGVFGGFFDGFADRGMSEDGVGDVGDGGFLVEERAGGGDAFGDVVADHVDAEEITGDAIADEADEAVGVAGGVGLVPLLASFLIPGVGQVLAIGVVGGVLLGALGAVGGGAAGMAGTGPQAPAILRVS